MTGELIGGGNDHYPTRRQFPRMIPYGMNKERIRKIHAPNHRVYSGWIHTFSGTPF